jgi:transcriptional accessory protein Tex/SPT6
LEKQPPDAWENAEARYQVGQRVQGVVARVAQFGIFLAVEPGIEGVLYAFELGTGALAGFEPGRKVQLFVKDVDVRRRRLELTLEEQPAPGLFSEREVPTEVRRRAATPTSELVQVASEAAGGSSQAHCPTCQRAVLLTWRYCVYCAGTLQRRCPACGTAQPDLAGARYCCECGRSLH